ncbi:MAG: penicillin-binding protein 2 [Gammaproteobacteria bacterium]|nr:penicillin-binding protein 2 [Gammaproteobacteria bacterium]
MVLLALILIARMTYLQVFSHDHFTTLSHNNRVNIVPIPPTRGLIFDRNGVLLAQNTPSFTLEITPERVADIDATVAALSKLIEISERDISRFRKFLQQKRRFESVPLRFQLNEEEAARFSVNRHRFPGVDIKARLSRYYPMGDLVAHSVGYVARINVKELQQLTDPSNYSGTTHYGKTGVERYYEKLLHGRVGYEKIETNAQGRVLRTLERIPPVPGSDLYLTIDINLQAIAKDALDGHRGAIVALEPGSGEVLALISTPTFDPNLFVNGIDQESYDALQFSRDQPLFNRAMRGQYPPGSTVKPFLGLAALEQNIIEASTQIFCPGWFKLESDERRYRDWKRRGHGHTSLLKAIRESCDVYFYNLALRLGIDRMHDFMSLIGFGHVTGIDISGELAGLMPSRQWKRKTHRQPWYIGESLITAIGQGFTLATPLQLAAASAVLANRGMRMQVHMLRATQSQHDARKVMREPVVVGQVPVQEPANWDFIVEAMRSVVHSPRGSAFRIGRDAPYQIAGKTGTAQVFGMKADEKYVSADIAERLRDHALFIAFAPVDEPRIAVAVVVENGGGGGSVAAPIARKVLDAYLLSSPAGFTP